MNIITLTNKNQMEAEDIPEPAKYLQINTHSQTIGQTKYTYFLAIKGARLVGTNERLFILKENPQIREFGYARVLPQGAKVPFRDESKIPERKVSFPFNHFKTVDVEKNNTLKVSYWDKGEIVTWTFKMQNQRMAEDVHKIILNASVAQNSPVEPPVQPPVQGQGQPPVQSPPTDPLTGQPTNPPTVPPTGTTNPPTGPPTVPTTGTTDQTTNQTTVPLADQATGTTEPPTGQPTGITGPPTAPPTGFPTDQTQVQYLDLRQQNLIAQQELKKKMDLQKQQQQKDQMQQQNKVTLPALDKEQQARLQKEALDKRQEIIANKNQLWNYQFLKGNEENLVYEFKIFTESFIAELIDELCLPEDKRTYKVHEKSNLFETYDELGLNIRLCFTGISEIKSLKNSKETVFDESEIKKAIKQFKNMNYLLQITRNKGRIRLPLANIIEYKGIVALVKGEVDFNQQKPISLGSQLEIISKEARVGKQIFSNPKCLTILPLASKTYESKLNRLDSSRRQKEAFSDIYYLDNIHHFIPMDLNFVNKDSESYILRPELLQDEDFEGTEFMGQSVSPFLNKMKTQRNVQVAVNELHEAAKKLQGKVDGILDEWQALDAVVMSSKEVEDLFHRHGVNIRYLGEVYDKASVPLVRKICMSEIASRSAKVVFRASVQETIRTYPDSISIQQNIRDKDAEILECNNRLISNLVDFLNSTVSETESSENTWKSINKQAEYHFNVSASKLELAQKYFIQALVYHLNIALDWSRFTHYSNLAAPKLFNKDMIIGFNLRTKNYNLNFTDLYTKINYLLDEQYENSQKNSENVEQIKAILNLRKLAIPEHFKLNGTYSKLCLFLSEFIKPESNQPSAQMLLSNTIFGLVDQQPPSFISLSIAISQIKWALKFNQISQAQKLQKALIQRILDWCGDSHPLYTDIYSIFAQFYSHNGKYEEAINSSKTALANEQNILGEKHQKVAERYYQLAEINLKGSRKSDSLNYYIKAKKICDDIGETETIFYAEVCYKVALISLEFNRLADVQPSILTAQEIYQMNNGEENHYENETIQCYELVMRYYEAIDSKEKVEKISSFVGSNLKEVRDPSNLERMIRIYLVPYFLWVKNEQAERMVHLFGQIPLQANASSYSLAYTHIKKLIDTDKLTPTIIAIFENFDELYSDALESSILTRWKRFEREGKSIPYQCLSLVEALIYFVGEGFVMGSLQER